MKQIRCMGCMEEFDSGYDVCPHCGYVVGTPPLEAYHMKPGTVLERKYLVGKVLGYGGFGVTYIGWDMELNRKIAIKEYMPSEFSTRMPDATGLTVFSGDKQEQFQSGLDKFVDEAKRLAKFHSTNGVIHIFDSFEANNTAYIVMEYLEGESLKECLEREGKLSVDEALSIILPILYALRDVHEMGIIHRDIAPDNIYLTNDTDADGNRIVKLLDFGAARFSTTRHSKSLSVLVKPGYSPEEQYRSRGDQGPWTDVYSVAATFYRMITGKVPQDSIERAANDMVKRPSKLGVKIDKNLENAILNAMNIKIENRTADAQGLIDELEAEVVKRRREHIKKVDVGKWPLWLKLTTGGLATAAAALAVVVSIYAVHIAQQDDMDVPEGYCRVPSVINLATNKAEKNTKRNNMVFQILDKQTSDDIASGYVLSQTALGGSLVEEKDNTLGVVISAGAAMTYVPDVMNFDQAVAEQMILDAGLVSTAEEKPGDDAPGTVSEQSPEADTEVEGGTEVTLVISTGRDFDPNETTTVPDIVGMSYSDAKSACIDAGLYVAKAEARNSDDVPANQIMEQQTAAGETVSKGTTIMVVASAGKAYCYVPDVQYKTQAEATSLLEEQGLTVTVEETKSDTVAKGNVVEQSVEAGKRVKKGSSITIYISKGNKNADNTLTANDAVITREVQETASKALEEAKTDNKGDSGRSEDTGSSKNDSSSKKEEVDLTVKVPNVAGQTRSQAEKAISATGLTPVATEAFDGSVAEGSVISQSTKAGSKLMPGSAVTFVVSKGPAAPSGWTDDASFVNNPHYTVQTKTQYRKQERTKTSKTKAVKNNSTSYSENGFNTISSKRTSWIVTRDWTKTGNGGRSAVSASENATNKREVRTSTGSEQYQSGSHTEYQYYFWTDGYYWRWWNNGGDRYRETSWSRNENSIDGLNFSLGHTATAYGHTEQGYYAGTGDLWFKRTRTVADYATRNYTIYEYKDYIAEYTHTLQWYEYGNWGNWGAWQDAAITNTDTVNTETRTVYLYTAK